SAGSSKANFELQAGDDTTVPELLDPEIQPPTLNKGPLSLDSVSSFNFPTKKLGSEAKAPLEATPVEGTKLGLQVTDSRGQDLGWNLKVSATAFETADKSLTLKGAVMTIPEGKLTTAEGVDPLLTPSAFKVNLSPTATSIMSATTTQGRSSWSNAFEGNGEKVTLAVPAGNKVASYVSTITWSLEDAP
ncbi:WxL domain-containing protein, partial [Carnobacterium maltaromaticum]